MTKRRDLTRREVLKSSAAAAGALGLLGPGANLAWAKAGATIRVGVVGCGQRGAAAARSLNSAPGVEIAALADVFQDGLNELKDAFGVSSRQCFVGLEAYKEMLALDTVDLVLLTAPPAFLPLHFAEAIAQGKHVFVDAPVAICPAGVKIVAEAAKQAAEKSLAVVAGTQRRHQPAYVETMKRIHDGAIGDIVSAQAYWNQTGPPARKRRSGESNVEWQLRNWPYLRWLSGDLVVEGQAHNIDVLNWAFGALPDLINSLGGQQFPVGPEYGNTYDHFGTELSYPGDARTIITCRRIRGTDERTGERLAGTKGVSDCRGVIEGENAWRYRGPNPDPLAQTLSDLIESIRDGVPFNEGQQVAESTLTAIMAREAAYSRLRFKSAWFVAKCTLDMLPPRDLEVGGERPVDPVVNPVNYKLAGWPQQSDTEKKKRKKK